jgi:hypothetical protein
MEIIFICNYLNENQFYFVSFFCGIQQNIFRVNFVIGGLGIEFRF